MNPEPSHDTVGPASEIDIPFVGAAAMRLHLCTNKGDSRFADVELSAIMNRERSGVSERPHGSDPAAVIEILEESTINCTVSEGRDKM